MKAKEADRFYEDDEDPQEVFAAFHAGYTELTERIPEHSDPAPWASSVMGWHSPYAG